ncbi:MAG: HD domain-containing protein [Thermomonas sp.]|uniref:HD-GYP domain-containing protein n=1 Tax=Thermomonas sp. TaxID=1971895 RepID=UPI001EBA4C96|nr:HD domain-containing phosphohydrolase [Thermomonas sp.]MBK6333125.1 HD domain-containing protein [Thermomonas sp.]MBK6417267.1 HD domain-containing protein [Thermomonas sp.]MBK6924502.1 HD domain-containing protein [Thermomonas sp.]
MRDDALGQKIANLHDRIQGDVGNVDRIGIALYNPASDQLSTFLHSADGQSPLERYQVRLADVPSLQELHRTQSSRTIDDLAILAASKSEHTRRILDAGYRSSYTCPLYARGQLLGFLFLDSTRTGHFRNELRIQLDAYAQLIAAQISQDLSPARALRSAVAMTRELGRHRDEETAGHVNRVAHYTRSIAIALDPGTGLSDEDIEFLFQFAGLHDIGKIAIPDQILRKAGKLSEDEYAIAQSHVHKGGEMIDVMMREFGLANEHHAQMLRDVIACHHERWDGSGYPRGLAGEDIPLAGRIVAVADVFDALTNPRPYKQAWSLEQGFEYLQANAGTQFDPNCVATAERCFDDWRQIYARFNEPTPATASA